MKLNKTFFLWLFLVVLWNFGFPSALPIYDVAAAVVLSFISKFLENKI
jgi:hypothetical protein